MGLFDDLKAKLGPLKDKAGDLAQQHGDKIEQGLEKAAHLVDEKTGGKYSSQIQTGTGKAKDALGRLGESGGKDGKDA
ncbi:antitoxin [Streptomyces gamaensis]|uniref:Antitoxin n=1 Tax=Streptomyces gamaensis TaxID=1763542 RepID=A0ABW0Z780_9ACTN